MKIEKTIVSTYLDRSIYMRAQKVARSMGISVSEYLRRLIINDLDKRSLIDIQ